MDFSKLSLGDKITAGSGVALLIFSFFPWYKAETKGVLGIGGGYDAGSNTGWAYFVTGIIPVILGLLLIGYIFVTKLNDSIKLPELPLPWPLVVLIAGGLAALLVILRLLIGSGEDVPAFAKQYVDIKRAFGLYLATLAAIGVGVGSFLKFQEDGGELPNKKAGGTPGGDGSTPTPF